MGVVYKDCIEYDCVLILLTDNLNWAVENINKVKTIQESQS